MRSDAYTIVLLSRPANPPQMSPEELDTLQEKHLAFNARMRAMATR
jgi:hypothetical protein